MSMWDKKYKEKIKKGYKDVTELVSIEKEDDNNDELVIKNVSSKVANFINFLQSCAKGVVKRNYTVSVANVTEKQITAAQEILNQLVIQNNEKDENLGKKDTINALLLNLYTTIPRKMSDTKSHLFDSDLITRGDFKRFEEMLDKEQELLDVMHGQVATTSKSSKNKKETDLNDFGLKITEATQDDLDIIKKNTDLILNKATVYKVEHSEQSKKYEKLDKKNVKLLYHGSRNENWWNILNIGLKIRPSNAIHNGSMFGSGIYMANKCKKSINYTSLQGSYWTNGNSDKGILALYEVNLGDIWDIFKDSKGRHEGWMSRINLKECNKNGHNSVFAKGGADLRNDEFIIYESERCKIKYLIELGE
jgi:poly [ADP-ribose] polymerase